MSNARLIFEEFTNGGAQEISQTVIHPAREESLYLDFKTAAEGHGPIVTNDRQNLAEALSGFANSDGGVIVWGVKCSSGAKDDPDVASKLIPIEKLRLFHSDLQKATAELVAPGIIGVEHQAIEDCHGSDRGYVVTYVPKSDMPQMARAKDQHRFYFRSGSSFLKMEPFMLADRYSRRPQPKLELKCEVTCDDNTRSPNLLFEMKIGIHNQGAGLALYPAIEIQRSELFFNDIYGINGNKNFGLLPVSIGEKQNCFFAAGADQVIHPNRTLWITKFKTQELNRWIVNSNSRYVPIFYSIFCDGFSLSGELTLNLEEIEMRANQCSIDAFNNQCATNRIIAD